MLHNNIDKNDKYQIINNIEAKSYQKNLLLMYQPILGSGAIALYQTLLLDDSNNKWSDINRLSVLTQKTILKIFIYLERLIDFELIDIFIKYNENKKYLLIKINKPLSFIAFRNNTIYWKALSDRVGSENFQKIINQWWPPSSKTINIEEFAQVKQDHKKIYNLNVNILKTRLSKFVNIDIDKTISKINNLSIVYNISNQKILDAIFKASPTDVMPAWTKINEIIFDFYNNDPHKKTNIKLSDKMSLIKNLSVTKFISMRLNKPLTLMNIKLIKELNSLNIITPIKNLVIDFSILKNNKIVNNYSLKILNSLIESNIYDFDNAMKYLKNAHHAKIKKIINSSLSTDQTNYDIFD